MEGGYILFCTQFCTIKTNPLCFWTCAKERVGKTLSGFATHTHTSSKAGVTLVTLQQALHCVNVYAYVCVCVCAGGKQWRLVSKIIIFFNQ